MRLLEPRQAPESFAVGRARLKHGWMVPFFAFDWVWEWVAYFLSHWKFLEVLEYLGSFSVLVAVLFYFSESGDRVKQKHYQAWQVINTAQGKGGSGGRIEAMQELNADRVPLVGVDASGAFLQGIELKGAGLLRANFEASDLRNSDLRDADLTDANLRSANFRGARLGRADFHGTDLTDADLTGADLSGANLAGATLNNADLHGADLRNAKWRELGSLAGAHFEGVSNAPDGFLSWAAAHGAATTNAPESKR